MLAAFLQAYFFSSLGIAWLIPNLLLILLFYISLERGFRMSLIMALWGGFWLDVASNSQFGFYVLAYSSFVGLLAVARLRGIDFNNPVVLSASLLLGIALINLTKLLLIIGDGAGFSGLGWLLPTWILESVVTVVIARLVGGRLQAGLAPIPSLQGRRL